MPDTLVHVVCCVLCLTHLYTLYIVYMMYVLVAMVVHSYTRHIKMLHFSYPNQDVYFTFCLALYQRFAPSQSICGFQSLFVLFGQIYCVRPVV